MALSPRNPAYAEVADCDVPHWFDPGLADVDCTHWIPFLSAAELGINGDKLVLVMPLVEAPQRSTSVRAEA